VQDAVATANALAAPLRDGPVDLRLLDAVQRRRLPPAEWMQRIQLAAHRRITRPGAGPLLPSSPSPALRLAIAAATPVAQRLSARLIGRGLRPESVAPELR